jgi:FKBP-type peptidyl-prolyl cis-trans isomerase FkpA
MKYRNFLAIATVLLVAVSCNKSTKKTISGMEYTVLRAGDGVAVEDGKYLALHMLYKDQNDSVWFETSMERGGPVVIVKSDSISKLTPGGVEEVFNVLTLGDSIKFSVTAETLFVKTFKTMLPPGIDADMKLTFFVGVEEVMSPEDFQDWQMRQFEKNQKVLRKKQDEQLIKDAETLTTYFKEKGISPEKTESGIYYIIHEEGSGVQAEPGMQVNVSYTGMLLDGRVFDSSNEEIAKEANQYNPQRPYGPIDFQLGVGRVISGWDEGIALLKVGAKATFYIPSPLAYGPNRRSELIGENEILVFDIELVSAQ